MQPDVSRRERRTQRHAIAATRFDAKRKRLNHCRRGFQVLDPRHFFSVMAFRLGDFGYEVIWWILTFSILFYVRPVELRPLSSIGFRNVTPQDVLIGLGAGL